MSRSGYCEGDGDASDNWNHIMWRGRVTSSIRGKRGQALLKEMLEALDAMPNKRLVKEVLEADGEVCALGCLGQKRGIDMSRLDPENYTEVAEAFGVADPLVQEIVYENDETRDYSVYPSKAFTPEQRWQHMRDWVAKQIDARSAKERRSDSLARVAAFIAEHSK